MYKIYFKQSIEMLKQNKFISLIAIMGTALAIMMIMSIIVTDNVMNISVAPEDKRDRTFYAIIQSVHDTTTNSWSAGSINHEVIHNYFDLVKTPQLISVYNDNTSLVSKELSNDYYQLSTVQTDTSYWSIYSFSFSEGRAFTEEEFQSGIANAIISETTARKLFKGEDALGQSISVNTKSFRIIGIVKDVSPVFTTASANIWIPYTAIEGYEQSGFRVLFLLDKASDKALLDDDIRAVEKKYDSEHPNKVLTIVKPAAHRVYSMGIWEMEDEKVQQKVQNLNYRQLIIFLILLLVPAINLSGLSLSRIKKRIAEIGVRKAFGAKRHSILIQVLYENLITSLIGGVIGLLLSYGIVIQMKEWLLKVPDDSIIPLNTLISFPVILTVLVVCILINLLSAGIPAYKASKTSIVNSLNKNDK